MKKIISAFFISVCFLSLAVETYGNVVNSFLDNIPSDTTITDTLRQADIRFDEPRFSFGNISQSKGPKQTHSFWFENTGKAPLFILEAISGCGCTVPKYTKDAVAPGERGKVDVTFDATDRQLGHFVKSVTVYINSVHSYTRLFIEGTIVE